MRVYFGGSFNPPHVGHDQILRALLNEPAVEAVHIVPTSQNPLKADVTTEGFSFEERWGLVKAWIDALPEKDLARIIVEPDEIEGARRVGREVPQYTRDTFEILRSRYPGSTWGLALGSDLISSLERWKDIQILLSGFQLIFLFERKGEEGAFVPQSLRQLTTFRWMLDLVQKVSSTDIRHSLATSVDGGALLPRVRNKILEFRP